MVKDDSSTPQLLNRWRYDELGDRPIVYRGEIPRVSADDDPASSLVDKVVYKIKRFRLWDEIESKELEDIFARISRGHAILRYDKSEYVPEQQNWVLLVSWGESFLGPPTDGPLIDLDTDEAGQRIYRGV